MQKNNELAPWQKADLPEPPMPRGLSWIGVCGPGVIVLGLSIGSGEFLLGPAIFVKHGLSLLWVTLVAVFFQTVFNTELMRYTVATGEPVVTGFMRTRPGKTFWAWFYAVLYFLQIGWPAWAATAAGAIFFLFAGRLATPPADATNIYLIGIVTFLACVGCAAGRQTHRAYARGAQLGAHRLHSRQLPGARHHLCAHRHLVFCAGRVHGLRHGARRVQLPSRTSRHPVAGRTRGLFGRRRRAQPDAFELGARQGLWHGQPRRAHCRRGAVARKCSWPTRVSCSSRMPPIRSRWRGWWRIVRVDQWGIFFVGALLGMMLPALLYVTFVATGTDIKGLAISAVLAQTIGATAGPWLGVGVAFLGVWILFKTQLDCVEGMTRSITDILWTGSARVRAWRGGDVRAVYYTVLAAVVVWGIIALKLAAPVMLLQIGANIAGVVFVIASLHVLYLNTRVLPVALRPPLWRRVALVGMALFYGFFVTLVARSLIV